MVLIKNQNPTVQIEDKNIFGQKILRDVPIDEIETQLNSETQEHNNTVANFEALPSSYKN